MARLALLTAHGGPIELAEFPLSTPAPGTAASANAGLVPRGALVP
jgi:hypothetical protein